MAPFSITSFKKGCGVKTLKWSYISTETKGSEFLTEANNYSPQDFVGVFKLSAWLEMSFQHGSAYLQPEQS